MARVPREAPGRGASGAAVARCIRGDADAARNGAGPGLRLCEQGVTDAGISVCIVCRNEADKLPDCLASVEWADEVLVMDLGSDDGSADVAAAHGAKGLTGEPIPIVEPNRSVLAHAAANDWVLAMDPDERVTPGLAAELQRLARRSDIDAVVIPFMNYDLGYAPTSPLHRYNPKPRMYRRSKVSWPERPNALPDIPP